MSSGAKSALKVAFAHDLGCETDDDLEAANRDALRATGRNQAAQLLTHEITKIIAKLKLDMESDAPPFRSLEDQSSAQSYLSACLAKAVTLGKTSDNLRLQMEGKAMAFRHTIQRLAKAKEIEERKVEAAKEALENPQGSSGRDRAVGTHPGESVAAQRKAEALDAAAPVKKARKKAAKKKKKSKAKAVRKTSKSS